MSTKKLQIVGSLGTKIYAQNSEPEDAQDGALWIDLDEEALGASSSAVLYTEQTLTDEQKEQARENIGIISQPDVHEEYFIITEDGMVALSPEYRGACASNRSSYIYAISDNGLNVAGSKNAELPKHLVIPDIIDGKAVCKLAPAIFYGNLAIKSVTLPVTINEISERCFDACYNLKDVYNTENIKTIGSAAFQKTAIERFNCPNLEQFMGNATFNTCGRLVYANVGKVTDLPYVGFLYCSKLNMVKSANDITSVGERCFYLTPNLKHTDFISNLTNIGKNAFLRSGVDYDWASLTNCAFGANATPLQYNPTDFWSSCTFTPIENRLPTFLSQNDARWESRQIGTSGQTYLNGCVFFVILHAYCGLHNISLSTVMEFENIVEEANPGLLNTFSIKPSNIPTFVEGLGLNYVKYDSFDQNTLQALYDALVGGKYALLSYNEPGIPTGHVVTIYGINSNGELLVADSMTYCYDTREPLKYALPISKLCSPEANNQYRLLILSL